MSPVTLIRGANASVTNLLPAVSNVTVGFSWSVVQSNGPATEVVACAIVCGQDGKAVSGEHVVFFNQMLSPDEEVVYDPDGSLPGGDQEQIDVSLAKICSCSGECSSIIVSTTRSAASSARWAAMLPVSAVSPQ